MPGQNTLFNGFLGTFEDSSKEFSRLIDSLPKSAGEENVESTVEDLLKSDDKDAVVKLLTDKAVALQTAPERNIVPAYNLLLLLATQTQDPNVHLAKICNQLNNSPIAASQYGSGIVLSVLSSIYNIVPAEGGNRYFVFLSILKAIKSTSSFDTIKAQIEDLDEWIKSWNIDVEKTRQIYSLIADLAQEAGEYEIAYQQLVKQLSTFEGDDASTEEAKETATKVLKNAFHQSNKFDFQDLTGKDAVQALRKSNGEWVELLDIFTSETLDEYEEFKEEHDDWIEKEDLDSDILLRKMRLLTLASLAASSGQTRSLPYSKIADALQIEENEVEMWVIDVIRAGLVEGKLSQLNKTFLIHLSTYRVFGDSQWREIAARLDMWKSSLTGVLNVIRQEKINLKTAKVQEQRETDSKASGQHRNRQTINTQE